MIFQTILWRIVLLIAVWWILTQGSTSSWGVGLISIPLALVVSLILLPPGFSRFSFIGLFIFLIRFLGQSLKSGIQVALMAIRLDLDLHPNILIISLRLPEGLGRVILVNTLNLLPGTLSVNLTTSNLYLHVLDERQPVEAQVRDIEEQIAHMLCMELEEL
ncbi:Na+/H+ antiporter subunit E [Nitrosomonas sp. Nm166]|uniref:Na+/H+ antiporter subunit E n=1 Tax=Nitrosomonas sp. Nm166 TaxID=1881054 RepID=UPI0008E28548|nr:Na+/H+ antiporter subunit E [Nitrosomonas sp. Nm166]SFE16702.1 multicomponent Na+:H+ antiporter subunit E [Nitrosomonas sp. Nm166]